MRILRTAFLLIPTLAAAAEAFEPPPFAFQSKRDDDRVEVKPSKDRATFSIRSPSGISRLVIERRGEKWPEQVVLQLHLTGLEHFELSDGKVRLGAAVSSQGDHEVRVSKDGDEKRPLDPKSPHWLDVRLLDRAGKPAKGIPLKDGWFEIMVPKAMLEGNPKSLTVEWIDFYRV